MTQLGYITNYTEFFSPQMAFEVSETVNGDVVICSVKSVSHTFGDLTAKFYHLREADSMGKLSLSQNFLAYLLGLVGMELFLLYKRGFGL